MELEERIIQIAPAPRGLERWVAHFDVAEDGRTEGCPVVLFGLTAGGEVVPLVLMQDGGISNPTEMGNFRGMLTPGCLNAALTAEDAAALFPKETKETPRRAPKAPAKRPRKGKVRPCR